MRVITVSNIKYVIPVLCLCVAYNCYPGAFEEGGEAYKGGNYELAVQKFKEVADKDDHRAMYALGSMYAAGKGVDQDYSKAFEFFSRAARYGRFDARFKMGIMYEEGLGTEQDYRRAARMYQAGAKKGYAPAQYRLGLCYLNGLGVKQDPVKASAWLTVAEANLQRRPPVAADDRDVENKEPDTLMIVDTSLIKAELARTREGMSQEQKEAAAKLVREYIQYQ